MDIEPGKQHEPIYRVKYESIMNYFRGIITTVFLIITAHTPISSYANDV